HSRALVVKKIPRAHVAGSDAVRMNLAPSTHEGDERTALGRGKTDHLDIDSQVLPTVREDAARDLESWLASGGRRRRFPLVASPGQSRRCGLRADRISTSFTGHQR